MPGYEYLSVVSADVTNWADIADLPESTRPEQTWSTKQWIWRPGATKAEERSEELGALSVLNELGQDGWKVVDVTHPRSRVVNYTGKENNVYGIYGEIGIAMDARYLLMREVSP
jgi:hypothetical protein